MFRSMTICKVTHMDDNTETVQEKPRTINDLIDLPYSEMTEDEIALVVEFKANIKARDAEHEARMEALHESMAESAAANREIAQKADALLTELTAHAIERYKEES